MTQICMTMPALAAPDGERLLAAALRAGSVTAVVLTPTTTGSAIIAADALPLIAIAQKAGAAVLISDDAHLARTLKADGVHLAARPDVIAAAEEAREILGQGGIVGVDVGISRHDAMEAGELGADYVAFGLPPDADAEDREERFGLVAWWAEIFEVPVVALGVSDVEEAAALTAIHCDFVSLDLSASDDAAERVKAITDAVSAKPVPVA